MIAIIVLNCSSLISNKFKDLFMCLPIGLLGFLFYEVLVLVFSYFFLLGFL